MRERRWDRGGIRDEAAWERTKASLKKESQKLKKVSEKLSEDPR